MIKIDFTLILTFINFAVLYWVLKKTLFGPMLSFLEKRESKIESNDQDAETLKIEADEMALKYREKIKLGKREANKVVTKAKQQAWSKRMASIEVVQDENMKKLETARKKAEEEAAKAQEVLKEKLSSVSEKIAVKIFERTL